MNQSIAISVIIPYGYFSPDLPLAIESASASFWRSEVILVTNRALRKGLDQTLLSKCRIVESEESGRGYFCSAGVKEASGAIVLFLHADTFLPNYWDQQVLNIMSDVSVAGGGFSTRFRTQHWFLRGIPIMYNIFSMMTSEFWGDRALFMRKKDFLPHLEKLSIPMMEDVEMSKIIRKNGKIILLAEEVSTSDNHFHDKGYFQHILEVMIFRLLYALGVSAHQIHSWYYRRSGLETSK